VIVRDGSETASRLAAGILVPILTLPLAACLDRSQPAAAVAPVTAPPDAPPARRFAGPVLGADGRCEGAPAGTASAIEAGIGECDLVRLKGSPPTDVLVGESGRGSREVQVLYNEPGGRELYFFVDNRLDRIVK
jgi:hypothetical protein